jgi:hypothetical protein
MKNTRKLIPAIAMLLVSAVMMSTASFAWFSMNSQVEANGMQVNAITGMNLVITNTKGTGESDMAPSNTTGVKIMTPSSTKDLLNFFKADSNVNITTGILNDGSKITKAENTGAINYYVEHTFYIRVDGTDADSFDNLLVNEIIVADVDADDGDNTLNAISKALRVGVLCEDSEGNKVAQYIFAPVPNATATYRPLDAEGTYKTASPDDVLGDPITTTTPGAAADLGAVTNEYLTIKIYLWYEGQDASCTTSNSVAVEDISVTVKFIGTND